MGRSAEGRVRAEEFQESTGPAPQKDRVSTGCAQHPPGNMERKSQGTKSLCRSMTPKSSRRWMAGTPAVAGFKIGLGRGRAELREWRGDAIQGVVCRDRLSVSNPVALALRQVCGSYRKRDFQKVVDRGGEAGLKVGQTGGEAARQRFARGVIFARNASTDRRYRRRSSRCRTNSAPCCRRAR